MKNENTSAAFYRPGFVRGIPDNVEETRTIEFTVSNGRRDRYRTVIDPTKIQFEDYNKNPIVGYQHYYGDLCTAPDPDQVIGTGPVRLEKAEIVGALTFEPKDINKLAEKIFRKVIHGTLKGASIGFRSLEKGSYGEGEEAEGKPKETYYFGLVEQIEWSVVNIGGNPDALVRNLRDQSANALMYVKRALDNQYTVAQIMQMRLEEIFEKLDGTIKKTGKPSDSQIRDAHQEATEVIDYTEFEQEVESLKQ